jgi:hypothetical protein
VLNSDERFSDDRADAILRRAIEIDRDDPSTVSELDIRLIGAEVDIRPDSLDRAFAEINGELIARPPTISPWRRWCWLVGTLCVGTTLYILSPEIFDSSDVIAGFVVIVGLALLAGGLLGHRGRSRVRIAQDGVHHGNGRSGDVMKWESIIRLDPGVPGSVTLVGAKRTVNIVLSDFGDPDAVLAFIRKRLEGHV